VRYQERKFRDHHGHKTLIVAELRRRLGLNPHVAVSEVVENHDIGHFHVLPVLDALQAMFVNLAQKIAILRELRAQLFGHGGILAQ